MNTTAAAQTGDGAEPVGAGTGVGGPAGRGGAGTGVGGARSGRLELEGLPLGPRSLTWKLFGDTRGLLLVGRTGVLQVMHPTISQALLDHSDYFDNPMNRILRSAPPILGVVYDEDHGGTAGWVRDRHRGITGERTEGDGGGRYRALDPDAFWWAHVTFFESQIARCELLGRPLTEAQKEQLYLETITWYSRYGLSMRPVPPTWPLFKEYWERMFAEVLQATPVALGALVRELPPAPFPQYEGLPWMVLGPIVGYVGPSMISTSLPPEAQAILGVEPTLAERAALAAFRETVRRAWPLVPRQLRRTPLVRAADEREGWRG